LRRLREQFPEDLVVLGIHAGKFPAEHHGDSLRAAVARLGLEHPIANDADFAVWQSFAVRAWPTVVLIDPAGYVVAWQAGEIEATAVARDLAGRIECFRAQGRLAREPQRLPTLHRPAPTASPLRYPGKLLAAAPDLLYVADTGHHRVLELRLTGARARVQRVFGSGEPGFVDGAAETAAFHHPQGLARHQDRLLVADTDNHAVRAIELGSGVVGTVAGTGEKARELRQAGGAARSTPLRSPWALLALDDDAVLVAMAGSHQIWVWLPDGRVVPFAGTGREALVDGDAASASFNQPSDLALGRVQAFVADAEASAVRALDLVAPVTVRTLVGQGLFTFGDQDGVGDAVRLQHPLGLAFGAGLLYVADSYNHKIRTLDPVSREVRTLIGTGERGHVDGPFAEARLFEPGGLALAGRTLWIADTNNHAVRVADLDRGELRTLEIEL
jgi:NHL repeat